MARILLIDDEKNIRTMASIALQHVGHDVESAADGREGLDRFGTGQAWDLTLLDHRMPGLEGLDVLREIRRRSPLARVIMVTAFGTIDLAVDAMKAGATDFLRKPFTAEVLRGAVRAALQSSPLPPGPGEQAQPPLEAPGTIYALTTLNGFTIESRPQEQVEIDGEIHNTFSVQTPDARTVEVGVVLSNSFTKEVRAVVGEGPRTGGARFWHALSEEILANHVWQSAACPASGRLLVDRMTEHLRRWVHDVMQPK